MLPNSPKYNRTMAIVITNDGKRSQFQVSMMVPQSTNELGKHRWVYLKTGSGSGDKYRVVPSTGELQLLDGDGLIRVASRLENTPQPNECSH